MHKVLKTIIIISVLLFISSCASSKKVKNDTDKPEEPRYNETFDPLTLNDEDLEFPELPSQEEVTDDAAEVSEVSGAASKNMENKLIDGFRVQLFATKDIETATVAKKEAEFIFSEDEINVYIEFDTPYYKLRIGDCKDREQAEKLREVARRNGFPSAWIVPTKVWSNPPLPEMEDPEILEENQGKG